MLEYTGPLDRTKMPLNVKDAYNSWCNQRQRCYNSKHPHYKYYGSKGIVVKYTSREFINWWVKNISKSNLKGVVVCERIDHSKGYHFGNIKLGTPKSNTLECATRGVWNKKVVLLSSEGKSIRIFKSLKDAAIFAKVDSGAISRVCRGNSSHAKGLIFKYEK